MYDFLTIDSVQIDHIAGDGKIYGEIMAQFHGVATVYRRSINNPETKLAGDFLSLTGKPYGGLTDWWTIHVSLYDGDDFHDIAVGEIHHEIRSLMSVVYDKPMSRTLHGQYGAVTVNYCLVTEAVTAKIEAVLIDDSARVSRVYGTIKACTYLGKKEGEEQWTEATLFGKPAGESVAVLPGGAIPMDRCIVAMHGHWSNIRVDVELRCAGGGIGAGDGDELLASGSVEFQEADGRRAAWGEIMGDKEEEIGGCGGRAVRVSIRVPSGYSPRWR